MSTVITRDRLFKTDIKTWELSNVNINHKRVYDRFYLSQLQGLQCGPLGTLPDHWPIALKPIINLFGMSRGFRVILCEEEYSELINNDNMMAGVFWMPYLEGKHVTLDALVYNGQIMFAYVLESRSNEEYPGIFLCHELQKCTIIPDAVYKLVERCLKGYTGPINVEVIGEYVIEMHLRWNGDNYMWHSSKNRELLDKILSTFNTLSGSQPNLYESLTQLFHRDIVPSYYVYIPLFIERTNRLMLDAGSMKSRWLKLVEKHGWSIIWDNVSSPHQQMGFVRVGIIVSNTPGDLQVINRYKLVSQQIQDGVGLSEKKTVAVY